MHPLGQIVEGLSAELTGWLVIVAGLAALAFLLRLDQARKDSRRSPVAPAPAVRQPQPEQDVPRIADHGLQNLAQVPDLLTLQACAAEQIDAAEHAFNRLLAECAGVTTSTAEPALKPAQHLVREPVAPSRRPLAA